MVGIMRVGLVRHFKVSEPMPSGWMTSDELQEWRERYDLAEVCPIPVAPEGANWHRCYASDLARAHKTAQALYSGEILAMPELREAEFGSFRTGRLRLPVLVWRWMLRLAWMTGHSSQSQFRDDFLTRVRVVADRIEGHGEDLLIVSHAGMMLYLRKELLRRGFCGPKFGIADHAKIYIFGRD
jgi:broad specificity phosphatase PhoE